MSYLINSSFGPEDIERATVPFVLANAAKTRSDAMVFLTGDALNLVTTSRDTSLADADLIEGTEIGGATNTMDFIEAGGKVLA